MLEGEWQSRGLRRHHNAGNLVHEFHPETWGPFWGEGDRGPVFNGVGSVDLASGGQAADLTSGISHQSCSRGKILTQARPHHLDTSVGPDPL